MKHSGLTRVLIQWADRALLLGTAIAVLGVLCLVTMTFARVALRNPGLNGVSEGTLAGITGLAILGTMALCFLAFHRGRRAASRQTKPEDLAAKPYPEHATVRTLIAKVDQRGRPVEAGTVGTIVHVHPTERSQAPAYIVEVALVDGKGVASDAHLFDARHEELELRPTKGGDS